MTNIVNWNDWNMLEELQLIPELVAMLIAADVEINMAAQKTILNTIRAENGVVEPIMLVHQEQDVFYTFNPATQQWEANGLVNE